MINSEDLIQLRACSAAVILLRSQGQIPLTVENCQWFLDNYRVKDLKGNGPPHWGRDVYGKHMSWCDISNWLASRIYGLAIETGNLYEGTRKVTCLEEWFKVHRVLTKIPVEKRAPLLCSLLIDELEEL